MSSIPQTPPQPRSPRKLVFLAPVAAILVIALLARDPQIVDAVESARLHAPRAAQLAAIPPVIALHALAALVALALGALLMLARKGRAFHRLAGWAWVLLVAVVAISSLFITNLTPGRYSLIHLLTGWTMIGLPLAVIWAKRRDVVRHRRLMMGLFYGGFAINIFVAFIPGRTLWNLFLG